MLTDKIIHDIAKANLEMLFASDAFQIVIEHDAPSLRIMLIYTNTNSECSKIELHGDGVVGVSFTTEIVNDEFKDLVKCVEEIQNKIKQISKYKRLYFVDSTHVIHAFNEIAIDRPGGARILVVNRDNVYSIVIIGQDGVETRPIDVDKIETWLKNEIANGGTMDVCSAESCDFVDYVNYEE